MIEMINIENVTIHSGGVNLFGDFSWTIRDGEHWVISGANGSGKTMLLEMIAGVRHIPKGQVRYSFIEGNTWDERYAARKRKIHYIPAHAMSSLVNPGQALYYQQRYYGLGDERTPLVRDVLGEGISRLKELNIPRSLSIDHLTDVEVTRLSNGQLKKLLLTKILVAEIPQFLLLDYPFEGLDRESRSDLCDFLDFMATRYQIQILMVDNDHHLPSVMNRRLVLESFAIAGEETLSPQSIHNSMEISVSAPTPSTDSDIPVITIRDLQIKYGNKVILENFNWSVSQGDRWALVGKNGAGKTTLFSMIFADHPMAYTQHIALFGRRRGSGESIWDIKKRIGYLGPELISYLAPDTILLSGRDYLRSINRKLNEETLTALIEHFRSESFMNKPVRVLSSGQLQLMLIMNCFLNDKELLLLDEPFQFLDREHRVQLKAYLEEHMNRDKTLILITHYEEDITELTVHTKRI